MLASSLSTDLSYDKKHGSFSPHLIIQRPRSMSNHGNATDDSQLHAGKRRSCNLSRPCSTSSKLRTNFDGWNLEQVVKTGSLKLFNGFAKIKNQLVFISNVW